MPRICNNCEQDNAAYRVLILEDDKIRCKALVAKLENELYSVDIWTTEFAEEAIRFMRENPKFFNLILLDHDLGGKVFVDPEEENTGTTVAKSMELSPEWWEGASVIVHSMNEPAAQGMCSRIKGAISIPASMLLIGDYKFLEENVEEEKE